MTKKITKIFTIAIMLLMMIAPNVNAATTITVNSNKTGTTDSDSLYVTNQSTLTVTNVGSSDTFKAYKVLDVYYNESTNIITYEFTSDFKSFLNSSTSYQDLTVDEYYQLTSGNITSGSTKTTSTLDKLASAYAAYIKENTVTGVDMTVAGTTATVTTEAGTYLVMPTLTNRVYAVMVGNLDFAAEGNNWNLNSSTIVAKVSDAGITKSVGTSGYSEGSFTIGRTYSYYLVGTVPVYPTNATNKKYTITDTLSTGITFGGISTVEIKAGEETFKTADDGTVTDTNNNIVATVKYENQALTIEFNLDYIDATRIEISYDAKLNENAVAGTAGNVNSATLTYSIDPYGTSTTTTDADLAEATAYTYGLEIFKYAATDRTALSGAVFEIYTDAELTDKVGTITTDETGYATYKGLAIGTYYLKEITAPTGYSLLRDAVVAKISTTGDATDGSTEGYYKTEIANTEIGLLPSTGGIGTIAFTLVGLLVVAIAIYYIVVYRKKDKKKQK